MQQDALLQEEQWERTNRVLRLCLPEGPAAMSWRNFSLELYRKVIDWEEGERRNFRPNSWDFCVIHSKHPSDREMASTFKRLLETSLGFHGRTLAEIEMGENTLQSAAAMVEGSTKVFILASNFLNKPGIPKFVFQEALMQEILQGRWRRKIVPARLPHSRIALPFGLSNIEGLTLGNDPMTVEMVSNAITVDEQMEVRARRNRDQHHHRTQLLQQREVRLQEIREVVAGLREEFGDDYDPTEQLQQISDHLRWVAGGDHEGENQIINVSGCSNISVGPSYHFTVNSSTSSSLLDLSSTPSTSGH